MDFVVVGFGLGALGVLLGVVMQGWLAPRAERARARAASQDAAAHDLAVAAEHRATGQAFLYAGAAILLATVGGLAGALDDRTGALLVTTTATVAVIGILLAGYFQRVRQPVPRRRGSAPVVESSPLSADPPVKPSIVLTAAPAAVEASGMPPDDGDVRVDPVPVARTVPETEAVTGDAALIPLANGGPAFGEVEPDKVGELPVVASPTPESQFDSDPPDGHQSDDADLVEEEEAVVVGFVVPATLPADSPSPPSRRGEGEDPS